MRYKHERGRRESALAFCLLQEMTGIADIRFEYNEHGKPSIIGHPDVHFNMSHCRCAVACAVDSVPVGIDIECTGRYKDSLARYTCSDAELAWIEEGEMELRNYGITEDNGGRDERFTVLWTKKEALLKLIGTGITSDIKNILHQYEGKVEYNTIIDAEGRYVCTEARWL